MSSRPYLVVEEFQLKEGGDPLGELLSRFSAESRIFKDREVLRADYIPGNLPHRWEHIKKLGEIVSPGLRMHRPSNVFIYGKTGTGKTAVVKHVFKRFSTEAERLGTPLRLVYVNCRIAGTEYRVLAELCGSLNINVPFTGLSKGEVFNRFRKTLSSTQTLVIVCLDEIDALVKGAGDTLLYELTRINEGMEGGRLSLIGVSNDLLFKDMLDPRVLSSLSEEEIVFHPYTAVELVDILSERARLAFHEGVMPQSTINLCAALAAAEHGDARRALDLLRVAAEIAERNMASRVEEQHVRVAIGVIEQGRVFEALTTLPLHGRIVLLAVYHATIQPTSKITSGLVYQIYRSLCSQLGLEPLTDRRVSSLISELDMLGVLSSSVVSYGRYGRTRKITLKIPADEVRSAFERDELLSQLLEGGVVKVGSGAGERGG